MPDNNYCLKVHNKISDIPAQQWDVLVDKNHPFLQHAFLDALEQHNCVSKRFGWIAHHLAIYDKNQLIAAMPLYEKHNNYGEFVFDQAWENAWNHIGLPYYPKLVCGTPYTPVLGQRLLVNPEFDTEKIQQIYQLLLNSATEFCTQQNMSGAHILFANPSQQAWLNQHQDSHTNIRHDCQFHWHNQNYNNFDDFLAQLKPKKRKNIRQERKAIQQSGVSFRVLSGEQTTEKDWQDFDFFYQKTFIEKWSTPTLNLAFFKQISQTMASNIVLVLADLADECIAGALMFKSDTHLYGRHWGAAKEVKYLHFETCFYQGIEYAIEHNLQVFEPGAGGEHKIARGFSPVAMQSTHWLKENPFKEGIERFINDEKISVEQYMQDCAKHSPYK